MRRVVGLAAAAVVALGVAVACGEVPTFPGGISYITPVLTPSPSVAWGDTLRDSLGRAAPLRVIAFGRDSADTVRNVSVRFLFTTVDTGAARPSIGGDGILVAPAVLGTLRLVGQVTDGTPGSPFELQTNELAIEVVPRADTIVRSVPVGVADSAQALPFVRPLGVTITGVGPTGARAGVGGLRVSYRIVRAIPETVPVAGRFYLVDDAGNVMRPDSTMARDTTTSAGVASRSLVGLVAPTGGANAQAVVIEVTARSHAGVPLPGSPVLFTMQVKP